jgi:hypothetical protein
VNSKAINSKFFPAIYGAVLAALATIALGSPTLTWSQDGKPANSTRGSWRFIVAGDSRNCGDIVMPAIAASSAQFSPAFYWHLGDLRAIYKIDEDIAFAAAYNSHPLSCDKYEAMAWNDFIDHQVRSFSGTPFFLGIGNHEVIPPKSEEEFKRTFSHWVDLPVLREQRQKDKAPAQPELYYHWIHGGVDFIYLDNARSSFSDEQLDWFQQRLDGAKTDSAVKSIVVGMHEALPDSLANSHSMGDKGEGSPGTVSGRKAYLALVNFRDTCPKPVYVLASHSHFYMENIFDTAKLTTNGAPPLRGWIVGTAGAVRYKLPVQASAIAMTDVYGYLVGTVSANGSVQFSFREVHESDVPKKVRQRYTNALIPWCFAHNSQNRDPEAKDVTPMTPQCPPPASGAAQ